LIVHCATTNAGKLREFRVAATPNIIFEPLPPHASLEPPEETGTTFEENAVAKALYYGAYTSGYLIAEDSGLEVDALGGAPGVQSARFAGEGASDQQNNEKLLNALTGISSRSARYVCIIALTHGGNLLHTFRGTVEGQITEELRGENGFGYDPLFYYPEFGCTFGQVSRERKQSVSHRGAALRQLVAFLQGLPGQQPG
jgi:XTP/dITP diphosphohydrolase